MVPYALWWTNNSREWYSLFFLWLEKGLGIVFGKWKLDKGLWFVRRAPFHGGEGVEEEKGRSRSNLFRNCSNLLRKNINNHFRVSYLHTGLGKRGGGGLGAREHKHIKNCCREGLWKGVSIERDGKCDVFTRKGWLAQVLKYGGCVLFKCHGENKNSSSFVQFSRFLATYIYARQI